MIWMSFPHKNVFGIICGFRKSSQEVEITAFKSQVRTSDAKNYDQFLLIADITTSL